MHIYADGSMISRVLSIRVMFLVHARCPIILSFLRLNNFRNMQTIPMNTIRCSKRISQVGSTIRRAPSIQAIYRAPARSQAIQHFLQSKYNHDIP